LGERFDIHTGGNDLKFPHHEDEIAQSEAAIGHPVVSIWVHGGHLQMEGKKMSKSAQNIRRVTDLLEEGIDPLAFRLLCFGTRYRSEMEFSWEALEGANHRLTELRQLMFEWGRREGSAGSADAGAGPVGEFERGFREAVGGDLDMPAALICVNDLVSSQVPDGSKFAALRSWDAVLALDLERWVNWLPTPEMKGLVQRRDEARKAKNFAEADRLRDQLTAMGLEVMDTPDGTKIRPRA
jgi:cysteinyl-tRNA synthetase